MNTTSSTHSNIPTLSSGHIKKFHLTPTSSYLRSDLKYGSCSYPSLPLPQTITSLTAPHLSRTSARTNITILDTNVLLHQFDVISSSKSSSNLFVVPQTSYSESMARLNATNKTTNRFGGADAVLVNRINRFISSDDDTNGKKPNTPCLFMPDEHHEEIVNIYENLKASQPSSSTNDDNDVKILATAIFYSNSAEDVAVVLLTDDKILQSRCSEIENVEGISVKEFVERSGEDGLMDLLANNSNNNSNSGNRSKSKINYPSHLTKLEIDNLLNGKNENDNDNDNDIDNDNTTIRGRIRINVADEIGVVRFNNAEVEVRSNLHLNRAFDGDLVAVKSSKVVGIIHNNVKASYAGALCTGKDAKNLFQPTNAAIPKISLSLEGGRLEKYRGKKLLVGIDGWNQNEVHPHGHVVDVVGDLNDIKTETKVVLHEFDIPTYPFSKEIYNSLPDPSYPIVNTDGRRRDLRHLPVCSIDPPGCKDIDDALHCIKMENGNYQIGVHIADVTHFVKDNSPIDVEAAKRSTSTYLVTERLDMLPTVLTTDLCSLVGEVDRYAFSVLWEMDFDGNVINVDFTKSIIRSVAAMTYEQAQNLLDMGDEEFLGLDAKEKIKVNGVRGLNRYARIFRQARMDAGALTLASQEVKFKLDDEVQPTEIGEYKHFETNKLVEEMMLFANITVAKRILRSFPTLSVLRRHPAPNRDMFTSFIAKANSKGYEIDIETSKNLSDSLDAVDDPEVNKILRILVTRCMSPAKYFVAGTEKVRDWHHYGLASPIYLHFTSPIRRYADVLVHRLLAASIGYEPLPSRFTAALMSDQADVMNRRHRAAQLAGRSSVGLHTKQYFLDNAKEVEAYVVDIDLVKKTLTVLILQYGMEGKVSLVGDEINNEKIERDKLLVWHNDEADWGDEGEGGGGIVTSVKLGSRNVSVFDKIKVKISVVVDEETTERTLKIERVVGEGEGEGGGGGKKKRKTTTTTTSTTSTTNTNKNKKAKVNK